MAAATLPSSNDYTLLTGIYNATNYHYPLGDTLTDQAKSVINSRLAALSTQDHKYKLEALTYEHANRTAPLQNVELNWGSQHLLDSKSRLLSVIQEYTRNLFDSLPPQEQKLIAGRVRCILQASDRNEFVKKANISRDTVHAKHDVPLLLRQLTAQSKSALTPAMQDALLQWTEKSDEDKYKIEWRPSFESWQSYPAGDYKASMEDQKKEYRRRYGDTDSDVAEYGGCFSCGESSEAREREPYLRRFRLVNTIVEFLDGQNDPSSSVPLTGRAQAVYEQLFHPAQV